MAAHLHMTSDAVLSPGPRLLLVVQAPQDELVSALVESEQIEFVGVASSTSEALELAGELEPNLVLVDIDDRELREGGTISRLLAQGRPVQLVGMTREPGAPWIREAVQAGVTATVTRSSGGGDAQLVTDVVLLVSEVGANSEGDDPRRPD